MLQAPTTFPVSHGKYAFLKVLSSDGDGPVYLAALRGQAKPWVIKTLPLQGPGAVAPAALKADAQTLARMQSAALVAVLASTDVEGDGGFVMEYVPGKSLAAIVRRAEEYSLLLPPELGLLVAHDAFAAAQYFHGFEGGGRVHGNISSRTILVGHSGEAKVAGYRPGLSSLSGVDAHLAKDLRAVAGILCDLRFERFPKELANLVPRLLEDVSPAEAVAAVGAFLHDHKPAVEQRRKVAAWLADLFLAQRQDEAREEARLFASGVKLLAPADGRTGRRVLAIGGAAAALLVGGLLLAHHRPGEIDTATMPASAPPIPEEPAQEEFPAKPALAQMFEFPLQAAASPTPTVADPPAADPGGSSPEASPPSAGERPAPRPAPPASRSAKRQAASSSADRLLRMADTAFGAGKRIEAINLGLQAVEVGGGARAHLALGEYYRSMHRYHEAINHYRAAVDLEPDNKLALTGVRMLEKKVSPCQ